MSTRKRAAGASPEADEIKKLRQTSPSVKLTKEIPIQEPSTVETFETETSSPDVPEYIQIIITGPAKCGKSCLVLSYMKELFPHREADYLSKQYLDVNNGKRVMIWDLGSNDEFAAYRLKSYPEADIAFLCFDIRKPPTLTEDARVYLKDSIRPWQKELEEHCEGIPIILVGLKSDLKTKPDGFFKKEEIEYAMKKCKIEKFKEVSAFVNKGKVDKLFEDAINSVSNPKPKRMFANCGFEILCRRWLE